MAAARTLLALSAAAVLSGPAWSKPKPAPPPDTAPIVAPDRTAPPEGVAYPAGAVDVKPSGQSPGPPAAGAQTTALTTALTSVPDFPPESVLGRALACLRARAAAAAAAETSTKLAVDLLIEDLCAPEMARAGLYQRNIETLARYNPQSERGRAGLSTARVDPETGEIINPPDADASGGAALDPAPPLGALAAPPSLRRAAAVLVLAAKARVSAPRAQGASKRP